MLYVIVGVCCLVIGYHVGWRRGNMIGLENGEVITKWRRIMGASKDKRRS